MSAKINLLMALCLLVISHQTSRARNIPGDIQQGIKRSYGLKCRYQGNACDPYGDPCCPGMKCANFLGGYCLKGVEKCLCLPDTYGLF